MITVTRHHAALVIACLGLLVLGNAHAQTATINYYTVAETDRDANNLSFGTVSNEVQSTLGPDGLPILNTAAFGCTSNCFSLPSGPTDVTSSGEITYWSPTLNNGGAGKTSDVTATGSATVSLPFNVPVNFFPPNGTGTSDANGFQAATLTATLTAPTTENISFSIGADDMAFAYLDGQVVCDLGGVHGSIAGTCTTPGTISAGNHLLQVFFVDINQTQSGLSFGVTTSGVTTTPVTPPTTAVPEPGTWALTLMGLLGLGIWRGQGRAKAAPILA